MILFALGGTTYGMGEETLAFYPLLIPVMIGCGFDSIVAVAVALVGTQLGCLASTVNPFATGVASATLKISPGEGLIPRLILLVIVTALGIWYTMHYADQVKRSTKSLVYDQRAEDEKRFDISEKTQDTAINQGTKTRTVAVWDHVYHYDHGVGAMD